ncbi:MAG: regulatory protein LuxR [Bradyrhizobium sp.]|nr:regulatory protein LuxR [Bradyrhizobium sp.]
MRHRDQLKMASSRLLVATQIDDAFELIGDAMKQVGVGHIVYALARVVRLPTGEWVPPPQLFWNFPKGWDDNIERRIISDPYFHACFEERLAVDWSEIRNRPDLNAEERLFIDRAQDLKLSQGITIPIHMLRGKFAYMSFIGDFADRHWSILIDEIQSDLFFIAHQFNHLVASKFGGLQAQSKHDFHPGGRADLLTQRERQCLLWSAEGKTVEDIGIILDLSPETVKIHLKRINVKLNASNRCHAVAKAIQSGIIDLADPDGRE